MAFLALHYPRARDYRPHYLKRADIEGLAQEVRNQLVTHEVDALDLETLSSIEHVQVNHLSYDLWISLDLTPTDEQGTPVLGLCEFDPGCGVLAVSIMVSPVGTQLSAQLALSTLAHELGHALFDAPAWIVANSQTTPDLFAVTEPVRRLAHRTHTPDPAHLFRFHPGPPQTVLEKAAAFAEFRANEFMGSLLVPRRRLAAMTLQAASEHDVAWHTPTPILDGLPEDTVNLSLALDAASPNLPELQADLAAHFGVTRRFIAVRMQRYGFLPSE